MGAGAAGFTIHDFAGLPYLALALKCLLIAALGLALSFFAGRRAGTLVSGSVSPHAGMIVDKVLRYGGIVVVVFIIMNQLGLSLTPLLGAAGIVGIAVGFASQTSVANVISGLFLIAEKPFAVTDVITVNDLTGEVMSIDTLSVKLRTFDNRFVRIPNEAVIKSQVINITRFPIRRLDINLTVGYSANLPEVADLLLRTASSNALCLPDPAPMIMFTRLGASGVEILLGLWVQKSDYLALNNSVISQIKEALQQRGIEIPFPQTGLSLASSQPVIPVKIVRDSAA